MVRNGGLVLFAVSLAACSGGDTADVAEDATEAASEAQASEAPALTGEYLAGPWCYREFVAGGETTTENINYEFSANGELKYQNNSSTLVEQPGSWEYKDGIFKVRPTLQFFDLGPIELTEEAMSFSAMGGQMNWTRGACT